MKFLGMLVVALTVTGLVSTAALAAQPPNPVPGPPVAYACEATDVVGYWDDQFFPSSPPLCSEASESFFLCLATYGQFQIETPSVEEWAAEIVDMYLTAGASATQGKCLPQKRTYWLCYGSGANSLIPLDEVSAIEALVGGQRVPHASKTIATDTKVGDYYLTCDDKGQKPTGHVVSTGNGGELVPGPESVGTGLLFTNPLDYTLEIE